LQNSSTKHSHIAGNDMYCKTNHQEYLYSSEAKFESIHICAYSTNN